MIESNETYKKTTILFPLTEEGVILGLKKQGFGKGWWNGFGGKLENDETYEETAIRETYEESGIQIRSLLHVANLHFYFNNVLEVVSKAYTTHDFEGEPQERNEMRPALFDANKLPFDTMWPPDKHWIPKALAETVLPLGFIIHFDKDIRFTSIKEVDPTELEEKF